MRALTIIIILCLLFGCKKYSGGPSFSLLTKKARVVGKWGFEINPDNNSVYWNSSQPPGPPMNDDMVEFTRDMNVLWNSVNYGTWKFSKEKDYIMINNGVTYDEWLIIRLKNNELIVSVPPPPGFTLIGNGYKFKRIK